MVKIIVEGDDDKNFFISLLNHLEQKESLLNHLEQKESYIIQMGGKSHLLTSSDKRYKTLGEQIKNQKVTKILFVFDCDFEKDDKKCGGMEKSQECFKKLKKELKEELKWDIKIDVYIFDRNLDYFLLETIKDKECYDYFDNLVKCLGVESIKPNKKPIANLYRTLYSHPHFDFAHPHFDTLKQKLKDLFS
jgi:hypothetical protein